MLKVDTGKNPVCRYMAMSELNFVKLMREEQTKRAELQIQPGVIRKTGKEEQGILANQAALSKLNPRDLEKIRAILAPA